MTAPEVPGGWCVQHNDQLLLFGPHAASGRLREVLRERGWRRLVVFASGTAAVTGELDRFLADALDGCTVTDVFTAHMHAPTTSSEDIAAQLVDSTLDALLAFGGGSASDTAKAVAVLLAEGGRLEDHCSTFEPPDRLVSPTLREPKVPIIAVPTTLAGAEVTPGGGTTTAGGVKRTFWDPQVAARIACYDPVVMEAVPPATVLSTGMNAIAHCVEGLYSRTANPISAALAAAALRELGSGLRRLRSGADVHSALSACGSGAAMAGLVISNARVGLHHAICHVLGAAHGIPHGDANAVMLPSVLRFNYPATIQAQRIAAKSLARPGSGCTDLPSLIEALRLELGVPTRLRDLGLDPSDLAAVVAGTMQDRGLSFNPRSATEQDVLTILEAAW